MMDNAGDNDTCIETLAQFFDIDQKKQRLRCIGHIINLIVKAILFGDGVSKLQRQLCGASDDDTFKIWNKKGPIGKLHNICVYINRNDQRREVFRSCQAETAQDDEIFYYQLLVDGGIRWNSIYYMIKRALKLRNAIDLYHLRWRKPSGKENAYDLSQDKLTERDWTDLEHFFHLLRPLKKLTKKMQGNANKTGREGSYGAVWEVLKSMDWMFVKLKEASDAIAANPTEYSAYYKTGVDTGYIKLVKYFNLTDQSPIYRAAIVLHPAHKYDYFEEKWEKHKDWITRMKIDVKNFYQSYANEAQHADSEPEHQQYEESEDEIDIWGRPSNAWRTKKRRKLQDELERYTEPGVRREDERIKDPLEWWRHHESEYPVLSGMAFDLFSIPGMSSECERVFSQTKKLITDERNLLGPLTVEADECQKHWINGGLVQ